MSAERGLALPAPLSRLLNTCCGLESRAGDLLKGSYRELKWPQAQQIPGESGTSTSEAYIYAILC